MGISEGNLNSLCLRLKSVLRQILANLAKGGFKKKELVKKLDIMPQCCHINIIG